MFPNPLDNLFLAPRHRQRSFEEFKQTAIKTEDEGIAKHTGAFDPTMPRVPGLVSEDDKENINPRISKVDEKHDRAHDVVRSTYKDVNGEYDFDETLGHESSPEIQPVDAHPIPTQMTLQSTPHSTSRAAEDNPADEETESANDGDDVIEVAATKKYQSPPKANKKRKASTNDDKVKRTGLRTRTPAQQTPFKAEKLEYALTKAKGRNVSRAEVEKQLKQEKKALRAKTTSKKSSRSHHIESESSGEESASASTSVSSEAVSDEYKLQHTTLRITVTGSSDGGIEVSLAQFVSTLILVRLRILNFANKPRKL